MAEVEFFGESFTVRPVQQFLLMEFAEVVDDADENGIPAAAAMMRLLREAVPAEDWKRFRGLAVKNNATGEDLMPIIQATVEEVEGERPTVRSSDSSAGPDDTARTSVSPAVSRVLAQEAGRPDRQMAILRSLSA